MTETDKERRKKEQDIFFNGDFKKYLKESAEEDEDFLTKLVQCATGSNYLPYDSAFKIYIEFDLTRTLERYPLFHTCTHGGRIPGFGEFYNDYQSFKSRMNMAKNEVYNHFDMK